VALRKQPLSPPKETMAYIKKRIVPRRFLCDSRENVLTVLQLSRLSLKKRITFPPEESRVAPRSRHPCAPDVPGMALKKPPPSPREKSRMFPNKLPSILQKKSIVTQDTASLSSTRVEAGTQETASLSYRIIHRSTHKTASSSYLRPSNFLDDRETEP
jgi:hypothetical protein